MPHIVAHHFFRRIRLSSRQQKQLVERSVLAVAIIEPAMTIPQIYEIFANKQAEGVSGLTWFLYIFAAVIWLLYGIQLKNRPLIVSSILWIVAEATVVTGTLLYSK